MFTKTDWKFQVLKLFPSEQGYQLVRNCRHRAKNGMRTIFTLFVEDVFSKMFMNLKFFPNVSSFLILLKM